MGEVAILNVAAGDTKLVFDPSDPAETTRSARIVKDMIRRGFILLIEVGKDEKGPIYRRAHDFDEGTAEYIVVGVATAEMEQIPDEQEQASPPRQRRKAKAPRRVSERIPARTAKAVAVARTAGG